MKMYIKPIKRHELEQYLSIEDLSIDGSNHAISIVYGKIKQYLRTRYPNSEIREIRPSSIVSTVDSYDRLRFPTDSISKSSVYTHYVDRDTILTTHTSAHIPSILDDLSKERIDDCIVIVPGLVYRRDVTDKKHLGVIHQVDIWRISKNSVVGEEVGRIDLDSCINGLIASLIPGWTVRTEEKIHPYTLDGVEYNLCNGDKDIELLEGGRAHPEILSGSGIDPDKYSGWAMGIGLDRLVMIIKDIPDIRYLRSSNPLIKKQMCNLEKYAEVSLQPSIKRDMSYCIKSDDAIEDIHDAIRNALGNRAVVLESIEVLKEYDYSSLSEAVAKKIGCKSNMKNVLVRITIRDLDKTLTDKEANDIYTRVYSEVNMGRDIYSVT